MQVRPSVLAVACVALAAVACTTRETGSIDLVASAVPSVPPPRGMTTPPCASIEDCPGDRKHRLCRVGDGLCVECLAADDCTDPRRPRCDDKGTCVECRPGDVECLDAAIDAQAP